MQSTDGTVRIAGAGVAGLTAAIILARAGREVVVYDRAGTVGSKHDGDFEGIENWSTREDALAQLRQMGLETDFTYHTAYDGYVYGPGMRIGAQLADYNRPFYYMVKRGSSPDSLDAHLLRQACEVGARVEFNTTVDLETMDIVATGSHHANAYAVGYVFRTEAPDTSIVVFDDEYAPGAYSYLLISRGHGTLAIVTMLRDKSMKSRLDNAVKAFQRIHPFEMQDPKKRVGGSGTFKLPATAVKDGRLYIGEAAGFQDYFAGFGMRYAMISAHLAARSILEGLDYDALWQRHFNTHMKASMVNRWMQQRFGNLFNWFLVWFFRLRARRIGDTIHALYKLTWYKYLLYPVARWSLRDAVEI